MCQRTPRANAGRMSRNADDPERWGPGMLPGPGLEEVRQMAIQIKSSFGQWKTVEMERAREFIRGRLDRGASAKRIDSVYLRGISVDALMGQRKKPESAPIEEFPHKHKEETKEINEYEREIKDCTVELENLARKQAFCRFQEQVLFSLMVWRCDESVRKCLPTVSQWMCECSEILSKIAGGDSNGD